jgi:molybdopterin molybdotransferase
MNGLLPVDEALRRLRAAVVRATPVESVPVAAAAGRTLAGPLVARRTQPPFAASAMDGYAVRADDLVAAAPLRVVGQSAAGRRWSHVLHAGEAVRIFTGAPLPEGADTILIQENARVDGATIVPSQAEPRGRFVRTAGLDFREGQSFFAAGHRLRSKDLALAASLGAATVDVRRRPRVAVLATGDELVQPGETIGPDQIVASSHLAIATLSAEAGAEPRLLGIASDDRGALAGAIDEASAWQADILVTLGGASVGDHDLVKQALADAGMRLDFWRIAMRPGKPLMFGGLGSMHVLGLPGNPASAIVCAHLFLKPLIARLLGQPDEPGPETGRLGAPLPANDVRQDYLRATLRPGPDGVPVLEALHAQDSSLTSVLAAADALIIRPPNAPPAEAGEACSFMRLD